MTFNKKVSKFLIEDDMRSNTGKKLFNENDLSLEDDREMNSDLNLD